MLKARKVRFVKRHPRSTLDDFGLIPYTLSSFDPASAREQLNNGYLHGGGWQPMIGFTMVEGDALWFLGDPLLQPIAELRLRDERIVIYAHSVIAVIQPDGSFEVSRMD